MGKGINYKKINRNDLSNGFIHCTACDKSFCGYSNLQTHVICKKHKKNLAQKPNNLVLLCVQCQLQFPTCQKIKEHYMLVQHDHNIPGIATFQKQLREELRANQIKYIQNLKTKENPFKSEESESESNEENDDEKKEKVNEEKLENIEKNEKEVKDVKVSTIEIVDEKKEKKELPGLVSMPSPFIKKQRLGLINYSNYAMPAHPGWITYGSNIGQTQYQNPTPIELPIDAATCVDIKHKIYSLDITLPLAVPKVPWIYCPLCKSFFTTFSKYNKHEITQRHIISMNGLNEEEKIKMNELFEYIKQKEQDHLTQNITINQIKY